ncbi:unnamed protein product, partial [Ectocarpus sp. 8 AP-2014]
LNRHGLLLKETESQLVKPLTSGGARVFNSTAPTQQRGEERQVPTWYGEGGRGGHSSGERREGVSVASEPLPSRFVITSLSHTPPAERPLQERRTVPPTPGGRHSGRTCSSSAPESHSQPWIEPRKGQGRKDIRLAAGNMNQRIVERERGVHHDTHREPRIYIFKSDVSTARSGKISRQIHQAFSSRRQYIPSRGTPPFPSQLECPPNAGRKARAH